MQKEVVWKVLRNKFNEEEGMLVDENGEVLLVGDDYHNQIFTLIEGFIDGYVYATGVRVKEFHEEDVVHPKFESQD